jgi:Uma2 family endonuclease
MSTKALMTVEQFAEMRTGDTEDYELVEGELIALPSATPVHASIRDLVGHLIWMYFRGNPIGKSYGEVDCQVSDEVVRRPDVSVFLGRERLGQIDENRIPIPFAPDIAVEVLSPSESAIEVRRKVREYLRAGTREVWVLDHDNGEVLIETEGGIRVLQGADTLESTLLPGFSAPVADLIR